jgi:hypothetical protein
MSATDAPTLPDGPCASFEANRLQFRDVTIVGDDGSQETVLEIEVRGKRSVGYCKSTTGAVRPFENSRKETPRR